MDNEKLLQAISEMLDEKLNRKLQPINDRLDKMESRLDSLENRFEKVERRLDIMEVIQKRTTKKLNDLLLDLKIAERDIGRGIQNPNDEMGTIIEILKLNDLLPL